MQRNKGWCVIEPQEADSAILEKCRKRVHDDCLTSGSKIWRNDDEHTTTRATSDGGTRYVKDPDGNWIHEALAPKREKQGSDSKPTK
jgi:hypothetical protein